MPLFCSVVLSTKTILIIQSTYILFSRHIIFIVLYLATLKWNTQEIQSVHSNSVKQETCWSKLFGSLRSYWRYFLGNFIDIFNLLLVFSSEESQFSKVIPLFDIQYCSEHFQRTNLSVNQIVLGISWLVLALFLYLSINR